MRRPLFAFLLLLLACRGARLPSAEGPPPGPEVWVAGDAAPGGEGSRERPLRSLAEALARGPGVRVRLQPGRYEGPAQLPPGAQLLAEAPGVVLLGGVEAPGGGRLRGLAVEAGGWGVRGRGALTLEDVTLSGQREGGVQLLAGVLQATGLRLKAPVAPGAVGLALQGGVRARVQGLRLEGAFARGIELQGPAQLQLESLQAVGPALVLHQRGGQVRLRRAALGGGEGVGLFVAGGTLELEDVVVLGHEYALQTGQGSTLRVRGFASLGAQRAGLGVVASRAQLEDVQVWGAGSFGALQLLNSDVQLHGFGLRDAQEYGLSATQGRLEASAGAIVGTRGSGSDGGDALHLREVEATLHTLRVQGAAGLGLLVAQGARARVRDLTLTACAGGGVVAETRGQVQLRGLQALAGTSPALVVMSGAQATLEGVQLEGGAQLLWTDCEQGARVSVGYGVPPAALRARCVTRLAPRAP